MRSALSELNARLRFHIVSTVLMLLLAAACPAQTETDARLTHRADFKVTSGGITTSLQLASLFVLPGDTIMIAGSPRSISVNAAGGKLSNSETRWQWVAPTDVGHHYDLIVSSAASLDTITLRAFVMYPFSEVKDGRLNNYRIGDYPKKPYKGLAQYKPPRGFIEVTAENASVQLTPHFQLGQFVCKQTGGYPKYVVLRELLLLKLEWILDRVNEAGYRCSTFNILSGYRTPWYNENIGNVKYSRHLWGGAADFFVDENPADDMMDDLNKDGRNDWRDAAIIYEIIDDKYGSQAYERFVGGLARYRKTSQHGPFVHTDVRGFRARWGD